MSCTSSKQNFTILKTIKTGVQGFTQLLLNTVSRLSKFVQKKNGAVIGSNFYLNLILQIKLPHNHLRDCEILTN